MDVVRDFMRGAVQLHVLHHASEGEVHGAELIAELGRHGHRLSPGTLYPMLHRLEAEGLLRSSRSVVDGRSRRVYRATPKGRRALSQCRQALAGLVDEVLP